MEKLIKAAREYAVENYRNTVDDYYQDTGLDEVTLFSCESDYNSFCLGALWMKRQKDIEITELKKIIKDLGE